MESINDISMEDMLQIAPLLNKLIEGEVGITVSSRERWLGYFHETADKVNIEPGAELPYESITAKCMRENRLVVKKMGSKLLGRCYIGRAIPIHNSGGEILGSIGYLRVIDEQEEVENIVLGRNKIMQKAYREAIKAAQVDVNILLLGETGTGKNLFARLIYRNSSRKDRPFVSVNCSAIPEGLFESEMFGYERGAFTGAKKSGKKGFFELAQTGVIFLDEIGALNINLQAKLLRVIQSKKFLKLGSKKETEVDVRVIAASNQDIEKDVLSNNFRSDLYFRLGSLVIHMPALRERKEDLPILIDRILTRKASEFGKVALTIDPSAYKMLLEYDYPGNIRELENIIQRGVILVDGKTIQKKDLKDAFTQNASHDREDEDEELNNICPIKDLEKQTIFRALTTLKNKKAAANALGISRDTLYRKLKKYGISGSVEGAL